MTSIVMRWNVASFKKSATPSCKTEAIKFTIKFNLHKYTLPLQYAYKYTVWHGGLINKLIHAKAPEYIIRWIREFLNNREFAVKIGETSSVRRPIERGVPQGAVLSTLLFSVFKMIYRASMNKFDHSPISSQMIWW